MPKTIAVVNQKGGVGKTTTVINLAAGLSLLGKKVLIIDLDPQGNSTSGLGIDKSSLNQSTYEVLINNGKIDESLKKVEIRDNKKIYICPSNAELSGADIELYDLEEREWILNKAVHNSNLDNFDYILIDCPPSLSLLTINAFAASDSLLVPVQCEFYAMEGLAQLKKTIDLIIERINPSLEIEGLLLTMFDSRNNICKTVVSEVRNFFKEQVLTTLIPKNVKLAECPSFGQCIFDYDKDCIGAVSYLQLAKELISKNGGSFVEKVSW
ncbi:MAG: ParA family protein [Thermodesulfobacteriota bacterium]|nr:ParA family protein [Thermodesulfobacteriota bacterium]